MKQNRAALTSVSADTNRDDVGESAAEREIRAADFHSLANPDGLTVLTSMRLRIGRQDIRKQHSKEDGVASTWSTTCCAPRQTVLGRADVVRRASAARCIRAVS